jgi:hypothetical protein
MDIKTSTRVTKTTFIEQKISIEIPEVDTSRGCYYSVTNDEYAWGKSTGMRDAHTQALRQHLKNPELPVHFILDRRDNEVWLKSYVTENK